MKIFFGNIIVLISEVIMLLIAILWYFEDYEKEPLIAMIALGVSIIITLFFRITKKSDDKAIIQKKTTYKVSKNSTIIDNSINQTHSGTGDNIGRDKIIGK